MTAATTADQARKRGRAPWIRRRQGLDDTTALEGAGSARLIGWDEGSSSAVSAAMHNTFLIEQH